ncbi:MAG: hypothetical protein ABI647_00715 [Gemmatimonadota bacterium]
MPTRTRLRWLWLGLPAALACTDGTATDAGEERPPAALNILRLPTNHRPFFNTEVSFYAKVGRDTEGIVYFLNDQGGPGDKFARLNIEARSLAARPDGSGFGANDSILITMRIVDPVEIQVELLPSGLKFTAAHPGELKLDYKQNAGDLNGDGKHDAADDQIEQHLSIWRQEKVGDPFVKIGSFKSDDGELKADLSGFSRWAIAY